MERAHNRTSATSSPLLTPLSHSWPENLSENVKKKWCSVHFCLWGFCRENRTNICVFVTLWSKLTNNNSTHVCIDYGDSVHLWRGAFVPRSSDLNQSFSNAAVAFIPHLLVSCFLLFSTAWPWNKFDGWLQFHTDAVHGGAVIVIDQQQWDRRKERSRALAFS